MQFLLWNNNTPITEKMRLHSDGELVVDAAVARGGFAQYRHSTAQTALDGTATDILWHTDVLANTKYFTHSTGANPAKHNNS